MIEIFTNWKDRNKSFAYVISILFTYITYLTYRSSFWRIDAHHDGYVYLSASQAQEGNLPPEVTNHHGIVSPFFEGKILNLTSNTLIHYRFIGLIVIFITAILIFRIIRLKFNVLAALSFSLLWLSANPSWVGSIKETPIGIQSIWPNLWVQLFTLAALFIILKNKKLSILQQTLLGIILATLPFIRIQASISLIFLLIFTYVRLRKLNILILVSAAATSFFWVNLIRINGGINLYVSNILGDPLSKKDYAEFITLNAILFNVANKIKYYIVISLIAGIILLAIGLLKRKGNLDFNIRKQMITLFVLTTVLMILTLKNPTIWVSTIYMHATTLLIDLSVPLSVIYILYILNQLIFKSNRIINNDQIVLLSLSLFNLLNLVNQFPLSDRGHKWWSSAVSVIFLAYILNIDFFERNSVLRIYNVKKFMYGFLLITVCLSSLEGLFFQKIQKTQISGYQFANFNGISYPKEDLELVENLLKSIEVLTRLEQMNVSIFYKCEDGLYYFRQDRLSVDARAALTKNVDVRTSDVNSVVFVCNATRHTDLDLNNFSIFSIGNKYPDLFLVEKASPLNGILKKLLN